MVQLALIIACSKDIPAIGELMEALEESGNLALISALQTWVHQDFGIEVDGDLRCLKILQLIEYKLVVLATGTDSLNFIVS